MLESDDIHLCRCNANSDNRKVSIIYCVSRNIIPNIGRDKSLVDDLNMGQGIVSRGACLPCDPLRFSPCPEDLLRQQHLSPHPPHPSPRFAYRLPYVNLLHLFYLLRRLDYRVCVSVLGLWLKPRKKGRKDVDDDHYPASMTHPSILAIAS